MGEIDKEIVKFLVESGIDFVCSVPCMLLKGILEEIEKTNLRHVRVNREEEGVGVCAGAYLAGKKPALVIQNSGLGNSINALLSLTKFYRLGLFILMSHRGDKYEKIKAQVPMGEATPKLLKLLNIEYAKVTEPNQLFLIKNLVKKAFKEEDIKAVLLSRSLWL